MGASHESGAEWLKRSDARLRDAATELGLAVSEDCRAKYPVLELLFGASDVPPSGLQPGKVIEENLALVCKDGAQFARRLADKALTNSDLNGDLGEFRALVGRVQNIAELARRYSLEHDMQQVNTLQQGFATLADCIFPHARSPQNQLSPHQSLTRFAIWISGFPA